MGDVYGERFRGLFRLWTGQGPTHHGSEFGGCRSGSYVGLRREGWVFDRGASAAEVLEIAGEVELFLGEDHYAESRPFGEGSIRNGAAVEPEVPRFSTDSAR